MSTQARCRTCGTSSRPFPSRGVASAWGRQHLDDSHGKCEMIEFFPDEHDPVNNPSHYTSGPKCDHCGETIECINITRNLPFNPGNSIKYLWRRYFGGKAGEDQIEPVRKARFYLDDEVGRLEALAKDGEQ